MKQNKIFENPQYLAPLDTKMSNDDFTVLTDRESVRFFVKDICNLMHHPVTILDINRIENTSEERIRIDSNVDYFTHRNACRVFRQCAGADKCYQCDRYHAYMFKNYLESGTTFRDTGYPVFFADTYPENLPRIMQRKDREVLEYHCPMLGYRELMFPIYFRKKLIGILILGQSLINQGDDISKISKISDSFFSKPENQSSSMFSAFRNKYREFYGDEIATEKIIETIKTADQVTERLDKLLNVPVNGVSDTKEETKMTFKDIDSYKNYIDAVCEELKNYENNLSKAFEEKKEKYFNDISERIVEGFYIKSKEFKSKYSNDKFGQRREEVEHEWELFCEAAEKLKKEFGLEEIYLFGDGVSISVIENTVKPLYKSIHKKEQQGYSDWVYDFSFANGITRSTYDFISSLDYPILLEGMRGGMRAIKDSSIILVCSETAVLIKVRDLDAYKKDYEVMANAVGKNISKICLSIALCRANLTKERHVLTLRMNRHESVHIASKLSDNMNRYFSKGGQTYMKLDREKQSLVVDDMYNTIRLISHMSQNIGVITGSAENEMVSKKGLLDVFDMLYKWQIMFRELLQDRNIDLVVVRKQEGDNGNNSNIKPDAPRHIYINPDFFELLVYNLVDNAVKYAHRGSKIYLNWCEMGDGKQEFYRLSVANMGPEIETDIDIYELYARGKGKENSSADGDGIGLYVVKRIGNILGLDVSHSSERISDYHLPLIDWYLRLKTERRTAKENETYDELVQYRNSMKYRQWSSWINDNGYTEIRRRDITMEYLEKRIRIASGINVFWVDVPVRMRWI